MEIADAVTEDGWILGRKMLTLHDAGAYARFSPYGVTKHAFHHTGAYTIPNLRFDGYVVFTNRTPTTAMRGFGVTSRVVRGRDPHGAHRPGARPRPARGAAEERQPHRRHLAATASCCTDPSMVSVVLAAAELGRPRAAGRVPHDDERARAAATCSPSISSPSRAERGGPLMAKHRGRGIAAIEYPTGMNQNGDP